MYGNDHKCIKRSRKPLRGPQTTGLRREGGIVALPWEIPVTTHGYRGLYLGVKWPEYEAYLSFPFDA